MIAHEPLLLFPFLKRCGEASLDKGEGDKDSARRSRGMYRLDWTRCDKRKVDNHHDWVQKHHPEKKTLRFVATLPPILDELVCGMPFALNETYLTTIRNHGHIARSLWGRRFNMDTLARERAVEPVDALVWSAMWLLADCAYDPEKRYYIKVPMKIILANAMAWKFWQYQTGRGLLWRKARIDELEHRREHCMQDMPDVKETVDDFIKRMKEHEESFMKSYAELDASVKEETCASPPGECSACVYPDQ